MQEYPDTYAVLVARHGMYVFLAVVSVPLMVK